MTLQVFQCGLSWRIVMTKSKDIIKAFHNFDVKKVAAMTPADIDVLMADGMPLSPPLSPPSSPCLTPSSPFPTQQASFATEPS